MEAKRVNTGKQADRESKGTTADATRTHRHFLEADLETHAKVARHHHHGDEEGKADKRRKGEDHDDLVGWFDRAQQRRPGNQHH